MNQIFSLIIFCILLTLIIFFYSYNKDIVYATGGAFIFTKHGGNTTDGVLPYDAGNGPGVDRSVNPSYYSYYYNNPSGEAGKYKGGECNHCHEPHSSFGGNEPPPNNSDYPYFMTSDDAAGPDPYLTFGVIGSSSPGAYAKFCWYCHENFINLGGSISPLGMGKWSFYQGKSVYENSTHYINPRPATYPMFWPGESPVSPIWPRRNRSNLPAGNRGSCLNCHTPHGIMGSAANPYDIDAVPADRQVVNCATPPCNPSVSKDYLIPRQLIAWEENLCEGCHKSGSVAPNIQDEINKRISVGGSGHPVDDTALAGRHVVNESLPIALGDLTNTKRHVECYDCHNPHAVKAGGNNPYVWDDGGRLKGMKYITIDGTLCDPASDTNPLQCISGSKTSAQPFIFEVCLKCHGDSFNETVGGDGITNSGLTAGNKKKEFQTTNSSFHPVAGPGKNMSWILCKSLQSAFNLNCGDIGLETPPNPPTNMDSIPGSQATLTINCTDCHNNNIISGGDVFTNRGTVTRSALRNTDVATTYTGGPVGPHGSTTNESTITSKPILRGKYYRGDLTMSGYPRTIAFDAQNFFCFSCHDPNRLLTRGQTNFDNNISSGCIREENGLHYLHLVVAAGNLPENWDLARCGDCHYNIHSNQYASNTLYCAPRLGDYNCQRCPPPTIATGLVNFAPHVLPFPIPPDWDFAPPSQPYPVIYYSLAPATYKIRRTCYLTCHGAGGEEYEMGGWAYGRISGDTNYTSPINATWTCPP